MKSYEILSMFSVKEYEQMADRFKGLFENISHVYDGCNDQEALFELTDVTHKVQSLVEATQNVVSSLKAGEAADFAAFVDTLEPALKKIIPVMEKYNVQIPVWMSEGFARGAKNDN